MPFGGRGVSETGASGMIGVGSFTAGAIKSIVVTARLPFPKVEDPSDVGAAGGVNHHDALAEGGGGVGLANAPFGVKGDFMGVCGVGGGKATLGKEGSAIRMATGAPPGPNIVTRGSECPVISAGG